MSSGHILLTTRKQGATQHTFSILYIPGFPIQGMPTKLNLAMSVNIIKITPYRYSERLTLFTEAFKGVPGGLFPEWF